MNSIERVVGAIGMCITTAFCPQISQADGFTGKDFMGWSVEAQDGYIQTSITMAGVVLSQLQPDKSQCIDAWYLANGEKEARNATIRDAVKTYPDFHPSGTILAILIQECGALK